MANPEQVAKLKEGVQAWNKSRKENPGNVDLHGANLIAVNLAGADLREAQLVGADLSRSSLIGVNLSRANLSRAICQGANLRRSNFSGADLREAQLVGADLGGANLSRTIVIGADLGRANLSRAICCEANLGRSDLREADLFMANLCEVSLIEADLRRASLVGADLTGADLSQALLSMSVFGQTNMTGAKGLESCKHEGPSVLDHATIRRSSMLPLSFLRGCGLPNNLIEYLPSLLNQPVQFYSCFISYSTEDQAFAERIHADLQDKGVRCWFAPHHIRGGKKIYEQIDEAIRIYDRLLLILSDKSMKSRWVKTEIVNARKKERTQGRQVLFPIRLVDFDAIRPWKLFDADIGDDAAAEVREYFIPDFSKWKDHDSYQKAFDRLIHDLKAEESKTQKA